MNILVVCGSFDKAGGRASSLASTFFKSPVFTKHQITLVNGGNYDELESLIDTAVNYDAVFWWANVLDNNLPKIRDVKAINPRALLVTSKRNDNEKYSFQQLVNRALEVKANLVVEFSKNMDNDHFSMMTFDPLGTSWYKGDSIEACAAATLKRLGFLVGITRAKTTQVGDAMEIPNQAEFFGLVREWAEIFHEKINPAAEVTRFLGNSSFRCQRGFPSFRADKEGLIFVSRRNVDKRYIGREAFVATQLNELDQVEYFGQNKPSVDTPIQLQLYKNLPNVNYAVHSHCYIKDAPFTKQAIPCGGLEEVDEVMSLISDKVTNFFAINLIGHGCIVMSDDVEKLRSVEFISRPAPEILGKDMW